MCRPPRIPLNADERTARRSVPATFVGCVQIAFVRRCQKIDLFHSAFTRKDLDMRSRLRITFIPIAFSLGLLPLNEINMAQQSSNSDLDALGKDENENWVWKGANLLRPDYKRALITLSRGGADADVTREFGPGSMTNSGYPRIAKKWKRGTPIESAESVYEGKSDDMSASHGKSEKKPIRLVHS